MVVLDCNHTNNRVTVTWQQKLQFFGTHKAAVRLNCFDESRMHISTMPAAFDTSDRKCVELPALSSVCLRKREIYSLDFSSSNTLSFSSYLV